MSNLMDGFRNVIGGKKPSHKLILPLLCWLSGSHTNIENMQSVNNRFRFVNHKVLISEVTLNNNVRHFIKYPKVPKDDPKTAFFYVDMAKFYGWTVHELNKNLSVLDIEMIKPEIAKAFGYDNKQRRAIGLAKLGGLKNVHKVRQIR